MAKQPIIALLAALGAAFGWPTPGPTLTPASAQEEVLALPSLPPPSGGSFSLIDHTGRQVADEEFRGSYLLVYFGYTFCPDVCPTGLQMLSEAVEMLGDAGTKVQPIFITVDPERDGAEALADYVGAFHPRLVGLTGTPKQIKAVAKAYGVRYFKLYYPPSWDDEEEESENGEEGEANLDYAMNHTAFTYLLGPDGRGLATFPHGAWPQDMALEIRGFIEDETGE